MEDEDEGLVLMAHTWGMVSRGAGFIKVRHQKFLGIASVRRAQGGFIGHQDDEAPMTRNNERLSGVGKHTIVFREMRLKRSSV